MKKFTIVTVIAVCLILCAAVWPRTTATEEVPTTPLPPTVTTIQSEAMETPKIEELTVPEEEKVEIPQTEPLHEIVSGLEPTPVEAETQVTADPAPAQEDAPTTPEVLPTQEPESAPTPAPSQTVTNPQPGDMVYVPGFGWLECQGPGEVIYDEKIYENGNKIGVME